MPCQVQLHLARQPACPFSLIGQAWEAMCCARSQAERSFSAFCSCCLSGMVQPTYALPCQHSTLRLLPSTMLPLQRQQTSVKVLYCS